MPVQRGKFIVLYGINNLGKSTQARRIVERLEQEGRRAVYIKYPFYDLEPSGIILNEYLRKRNPFKLTPREAQLWYAYNRLQFEPTLRRYLEEGITVVAEDYTGTGIAWGIGAGVDRDYLFRANCSLLKEDLAICFDGKRFLEGREDGHTHESNDELTERVRLVHLELAKEFGWTVVNANATKDEIQEVVWNIVKPLFL